MNRPPGDSRNELSDWLEGFLFDRRITVVRGPLDDMMASRVATELMTLDATGDEPVTFQMDSSGGSLSAAFTLIDVMDVLGVPVNVVCLGRVEGTAVAVAAAGTHRLALPNARFRFGDPDCSFEAAASEVELLAAEHRESLERYHACLSRFSGKSGDEVASWCAARRSLDALEALEVGLIDEVAREKAPLRPIRPLPTARN
ncbi:MAG: ATP-dependent Clp protease proteolytic subunit [Acidimicrobiales bacterium]